MVGVGVAIFTDEDVDGRLAGELRRRGYDAVSCRELGRSNLGVPDDDQLAAATEQGRALLTFNARDYIRLDREWKAAGRAHAGIIVSVQIQDLGELLRRVELHLRRYSPHEQADRLLWLAG
ncbi:MAG TPA: DUF5615 family PIN-like protein [Thermomicrobiales bacterium]|nr:DUF5615 family PIN-like protein [Thermomicrobiales bacterium]